MKSKLDIDRIIEIVEAFEREKSNDVLDGKVMFGLSKLIAKIRPTYRHFIQTREPFRLSTMKQILIAKTDIEREVLNSDYLIKEVDLKKKLKSMTEKDVEHFDFKESHFIAQEDILRKRFVGEGSTLRMEDVTVSKGTHLVSGEFIAAMGDLIQ